MLQVLILRLYCQCLRYGLEQLTVALGTAVTPLTPLTWFALMLQPCIVETHSFLQQPLEVSELPSAHTIEA